MDTIEGMRTFAAVAAHQSFTEGARQVGISTRLASKYIRQLEERLNAQLFHRTTRVVTLTETGRAYFERCQPLIEQIDELESVVQQRQTELAGRIRVTAATGFGTMFLVDLLRPFQEAHPNITVDLNLSDHNVSVVEEGFDLALRFGGLRDSALMARKLTDMRIICCASPAYLERHGTPQDPTDLPDHDCMPLILGDSPNVWRFRRAGEVETVVVAGRFRSNAPPAVVRMAAGGVGICRLPHYVVAPFLQDGRLVEILQPFEIAPIALYAVYPPSRHLSARIRTLIDHLAEGIHEQN